MTTAIATVIGFKSAAETNSSVDVQFLAWGNFVIEAIRPEKLRDTTFAEFLPAKVCLKKDGDEKILWNFVAPAPGARAFLRDHKDEIVIMTIANNAIIDVTAIADLPKHQVFKDASGAKVRIGGRPVGEMLAIKRELSRIEDLRLVLSPVEEKLNAHLEKKLKEQRDADSARINAEKEAQREAEVRRRLERLALLNKRPLVIAYREDGARVKGIPVVGREYESLPDDKACIAVESYDDVTHFVGNVISAFYVNKNSGGRVSKRGEVPVRETPPLSAAPAVTIEQDLFLYDGEPVVAIIVQNFDQVKGLRTSGINSGTFVVVPEKESNDSFHLYSLVSKEIKDKGVVQKF